MWGRVFDPSRPGRQPPPQSRDGLSGSKTDTGRLYDCFSEVPNVTSYSGHSSAGRACVFTVACTNKKVNNPLANVGSKQPDKVLFDRAMDAMKHNRFDVARITLQTLINTYPDSEFIARAKLAVADSWYAEGGGTALAQAEIEYKDFETFFPNMPEAAEAQLKIANIHYQQMEKPDRDYTHAMRAEEEYRQLILQYPDNKKVVEEGKQRLLEVQEVIAEREFRVGRFLLSCGSPIPPPSPGCDP